MIAMKWAFAILVTAISLILLFHALIVLKFIPYDITWGGRLKNDQEMYAFEAFSIVMNVLFLWVLLMEWGKVKSIIGVKVRKGILWFFFGLFALNTVGNVLAVSNFEKSFALVTALFTYLLWTILRSKEKTE